MVNFYKNNKYIKKWCEKVTGNKPKGYNRDNTYLYQIAYTLNNKIEKSQKDNYYLRKICEAVTGEDDGKFHSDNYYLKNIAKTKVTKIKPQGTNNYYLRLICENWKQSKEIIVFPTINTIHCFNDSLPAPINVKVDEKYNNIPVELYVNGENIQSAVINDGVINIELDKSKLLNVKMNNCYLKVNSEDYDGRSDNFIIYKGVVVNIITEAVTQ